MYTSVLHNLHVGSIPFVLFFCLSIDGYWISHFLVPIFSSTITWLVQGCSRGATEEGDFARGLSTTGSSGTYLFQLRVFHFCTIFFLFGKKGFDVALYCRLEIVGWSSIVGIHLYFPILTWIYSASIEIKIDHHWNKDGKQTKFPFWMEVGITFHYFWCEYWVLTFTCAIEINY